MRESTQIIAIAEQTLNSAIFALEATIVSVSGGTATVQPTPTRIFGDNPEPQSYPKVEGVRLLSLVWNGGASGISGQVKAGDPCLLIALSHGNDDEPDHKTLSSCVALCGFSDSGQYPMPDGAGVRAFSGSAFITLDDGRITASTGQGVFISLSGDKATITAPGGITLDAPQTTVTGNMTIAGAVSQGAGGGGNATFGGSVNITGTSTAADHLSGGKSGKTHTHTDGDGEQTSAPN